MKIKLIAAAVALSAWTGAASAIVVTEDGYNDLSDVLGSIGANVNANADQLIDANDSHWQVSGAGAATTIVFELAGKKNHNTFGIYDLATPGTKYQLFDGANGVDDQVTLSVTGGGDVTIGGMNVGSLSSNTFGFYLSRPANQGGEVFYSDSALNAGGLDQMAAFQGDGSTLSIPGSPSWDASDYILAWEDLIYKQSDHQRSDVNDFVVFIEDITAVPEPGTLALLGLGLAGLGAARRRKA